MRIMRKTVLIVESVVYGALDLERIFENNPKMTVIRCRIEEDVMRYIESHSVDVIILDPFLPKSFLKLRKFVIKKIDSGEVGFILMKEVERKITKMEKRKRISIKKPRFIFNTHLTPEELEKVGFTDVRDNYVLKPVAVKNLLKVMVDNFTAAAVIEN